jgi:hypothetical protein
LYQKPGKFQEFRVLVPDFDLIWEKRSKIAKNHHKITTQNRCPFGRRTLSSCFSA